MWLTSSAATSFGLLWRKKRRRFGPPKHTWYGVPKSRVKAKPRRRQPRAVTVRVTVDYDAYPTRAAAEAAAIRTAKAMTDRPNGKATITRR